MRRKICILFFLWLICDAGNAQQNLSGKILKRESADIVPGVNVRNSRTNRFSKSDMGGNYRILVVAGDTLFFTSAGYVPDTIVVTNVMLTNEYDVYLINNVVALPNIEIDALSKYEADSVNRREEYAYILDKKHPVKLVNEKRPGDAPGLNFSPVGFFSKHERDRRKLLKQLKDEDENEYIDVRFSRSKVAQVTKLNGDSLQHFMLRYRPDYNFCRQANNQDMLFYINDKIILFRRGVNKKSK